MPQFDEEAFLALNYIKKCNDTVDRILVEQLRALDITVRDPSLTRKHDHCSSEVWWHDRMILRAKYTPEANIWYIRPSVLAEMKNDHARVMVTETQLRSATFDIVKALENQAAAALPSSGVRLRPKKMERTQDSDGPHVDDYYCDHCGKVLPNAHAEIPYTELPFDIASANKGESGVICRACDTALWKKINESRFCERCGDHFAVHNDDGSCVEDTRLVSVIVFCKTPGCPLKGCVINTIPPMSARKANIFMEAFGHGSEDDADCCSMCHKLGEAHIASAE